MPGRSRDEEEDEQPPPLPYGPTFEERGRSDDYLAHGEDEEAEGRHEGDSGHRGDRSSRG